MNLVGFANSRFGPATAMCLVRALPAGAAKALGAAIANRLARQSDSPLVRAVRTNQGMARGLPYDHPELDLAVGAVLRNLTLHYLSLFRVIQKGWTALRAAAQLDSEMIARVHAILEAGTGMVYAGPHTMGFDHLLLMIGGLDYPIQVLSYPDPRGSYTVQNRIRRRFGLDLEPVSYDALRRALRHLRSGGIVLTGLDRPFTTGERLRFFGRETLLPIGAARLAVRTGVPLMVGASYADPDGIYRADCLDVMQPHNRGDERQKILQTAQQAISALEPAIRKRPEQWLMLHPLWPQPVTPTE